MDAWVQYLKSTWGLNDAFAKQITTFIAYLYQYGIFRSITSGWRDPEKQKEMQARWDRGDRAGLRARPASDSLHTRTNWLGKPNAQAIDITTSNDRLAEQIARYLGIGCGADFKSPDHGHYYAVSA